MRPVAGTPIGNVVRPVVGTPIGNVVRPAWGGPRRRGRRPLRSPGRHGRDRAAAIAAAGHDRGHRAAAIAAAGHDRGHRAAVAAIAAAGHDRGHRAAAIAAAGHDRGHRAALISVPVAAPVAVPGHHGRERAAAIAAAGHHGRERSRCDRSSRRPGTRRCDRFSPRPGTSRCDRAWRQPPARASRPRRAPRAATGTPRWPAAEGLGGHVAEARRVVRLGQLEERGADLRWGRGRVDAERDVRTDGASLLHRDEHGARASFVLPAHEAERTRNRRAPPRASGKTAPRLPPAAPPRPQR